MQPFAITFFSSSTFSGEQAGGGEGGFPTCLERLQRLRLGSWWAQTHFKVLYRMVWAGANSYRCAGHYVDLRAENRSVLVVFFIYFFQTHEWGTSEQVSQLFLYGCGSSWRVVFFLLFLDSIYSIHLLLLLIP